jgi:glucose/arabinose dehydrogenase
VLALFVGHEVHAAVDVSRLSLPTGYTIEPVAEVRNARQMALADDGTLFVGSRSAGTVTALKDTDADGYYDWQITVDKDLNLPSGLAIHNQDLYVAAVDKIYRYPNILTRVDNPPLPELFTDNLPDDMHHGWKYIKFGPNDELYVNVGAPCNVCLEKDPRYASILRINLESKGQTLVASGVRNSVGFDFNPTDNTLWFTDNGRDNLGDDQPSCELNHAPEEGLHFGFPFVHASNILDPEFGDQASGKYEAPAAELGAHVAPLGMTFYTGDQFPAADQNTIFIAEHGSWNRSRKVGYRIVKVQIDGDKVISHEPFISGWLVGQRHWGRPADVLVDKDGSLLISDDYAGQIYRVRWDNS